MTAVHCVYFLKPFNSHEWVTHLCFVTFVQNFNFLHQPRLLNNKCAALPTMSQFILLLFLDRKSPVESKHCWGNANSRAMPKHLHKQSFSLLSSIKFNFWGHVAVSHFSNVARMVSQLRGMRWKSHYSVHILEKCWLRGKLNGLSRIAAGLLGF